MAPRRLTNSIKGFIARRRRLLMGILVALLVVFAGVNLLVYQITGLWPHQKASEIILSEEMMAEILPTLTREYPAVIKGNWEPNESYMALVLAASDRLRGLGVNTLSCAAEYEFKDDGSYFMRNEGLRRSNLVRAKQMGFAVYVGVSFVGSGQVSIADRGAQITLEEYLEISEELALEWARFAEECGVEYFCPQQELDYMILQNFILALDEAAIAEGARVVAEWHRDILPKVKEVYSGKVVAKFAYMLEGKAATGEYYRGYDYLGVAIGHGQQSLEEFRPMVRENYYEPLAEMAGLAGCDWIVGEAWLSYGGRGSPFYENVEGESLDELQDDYYRIMIEEYLGFSGMKPAGFIFCAWRMPGLRVSDRPAEEVLREFFTQSLGS